MTISIPGTGVQSDNFLPGVMPGNPALSAKHILSIDPTAPSGWYWIAWPGVTGNQPVLMYCDMTGANCGSSFGGWTRLDEGWLNMYHQILVNNSTANRTKPGYEPAIRMTGYKFTEASSNGTMYFEELDSDTLIYGIKFLVPVGTRGIRVRRFDIYSINGPDGYVFNDSGDNPNETPTRAQIVQVGDGSPVTVSSNYSCFGIYMGDKSANGKRVYIGNSAAPWAGEINGGFASLPASRFVQHDDIGNDADRIIFYDSDGTTENYRIYGFEIYVR